MTEHDPLIMNDPGATAGGLTALRAQFGDDGVPGARRAGEKWGVPAIPTLATGVETVTVAALEAPTDTGDAS